MKPNEYIDYMKTIAPFQTGQREYLDFVERIKGESSETLTPSQLLEIKETSEKRKESLDKLRTQMKKLQNFLPIDVYKSLMSSIENEYALATMLQEDCENFIKGQDNKYLESVLYGLGEEKEYNEALAKSLKDVEYRFGIGILNDALTGKMEIQDIKDIALSLEENTPLRQNLDHLITDLERKEAKQRKEAQEEKTEEPEQAEETPQEQPEEEQEEEKKVTLAERIASVNYQQRGNIVEEVQQLTIEDRLEQVDKKLEELLAKEKPTLADMIAIQTLEQEKLDLNAYMDTLDDQKQSLRQRGRDRKISKTDEKIEEGLENLRRSRENYEAYDSRLMRFFSMRYQEQMQENLARLREKRGVLQQQQRISAVAKFDKQSGHIARKAAVLGTVRGIHGYTSAKIEELKAFREQVVQEFQAIQKDASRFTSRKSDVEVLRQKVGARPDEIISIEEVRSLQGQVMAA